MFQWRFVGGLKYAKKLLVIENKMIDCYLIPDFLNERVVLDDDGALDEAADRVGLSVVLRSSR